MLRQAVADRLKQAMKARDPRTVSAVRLILAALKDRDIAARGEGNNAGIAEPEILRMMQGMIKQRRESIELYAKGGRDDLVRQEADEIAVIESFLPHQMDAAETRAAVEAAIAASGASERKDMGRDMAQLRESHAGVIDLGLAGTIVKELLA
jgi:uncharacterized protein YqeY